jgi:hypothetical protein
MRFFAEFTLSAATRFFGLRFRITSDELGVFERFHVAEGSQICHPE